MPPARLAFDNRASHVKQHNVTVELRASTLIPQKELQFMCLYERYVDDGGK